jgi:hypothetical protein
MSAQYKLKKYVNKLENASSVESMNSYYKKLLKYKFPQSGGVLKEQMPWTTNVEQFVKKIADLKGLEELTAKTAEIQQLQDKLNKLVGISQDYQDSLKYALEDIKKVTATEIPDVASKVGEISKLLQSLQVGDISGKSAEEIMKEVWGQGIKTFGPEKRPEKPLPVEAPVEKKE